MATVAVTAHNNRVEPADTTTNWSNDGGGGGIATETDFTYQNAIAASRKVGTTVLGRAYTHGSNIDMTATDRTTYLAKIAATNPAVLLSRSSPALHMKIGSDASNYHWYYLFGNDNYPPKGGFILIGIDPNVTGYQGAADTGSPNDAQITYWSLRGDFSTGSKAENVVIDAIDVGAGLNLVGGDGASTDGVFADFISADEGTAANRYGYVFTDGSIIFVNGRLAIGQNNSDTSVLTVFQDTGSVVVWQNGLYATGWARLRLDVATTSTDIDIIGATLIGDGEKDNGFGGLYTTTEDTRPILEVTGTAGTCDLTSCALRNFSDVVLTSVTTITGCDITTESMTQSSAEIDSCTIRTTSVTSIATLQDPTFGTSDLHDTEFVQAGAGHAVEIDTATTYTFTNMTWTGYGADASDSAALDVTAASGTVTINVVGGTTPTYKTAGATVDLVINPVTTEIHVVDIGTASDIQNARVLLLASDGTGDLPFEESVTITRVTTVATVAHTAHGLVVGDIAFIEGADQQEYNGAQTVVTVPGVNSYTFTVAGAPATPATGTIISTGGYFNELTNASGIVTDTRSITVDQPMTGTVRKGTSSPLYKSSPVTATVDQVNGLDLLIQLIPDE
jgi:hypothetical protein